MLYAITLLVFSYVDEKYTFFAGETSVYSSVPVVSCVYESVTIPGSSEKQHILYCKTEQLYAAMTGQEYHKIKITGSYRV